MMNRQEKDVVIKELRADLQGSEGLFLVDVQGLSVAQIQTFRKNLRRQKSRLKVAKNTLVKIAVEEIPGMSLLDPYLNRQVALVITSDETSAVAKIVTDMAQEYESMKIVAGFFESNVMTQDMIRFLATLPPRAVLAARVCGGLKAPLVRHVSVLNQVLARFLGVLKQIEAKRQ